MKKLIAALVTMAMLACSEVPDEMPTEQPNSMNGSPNGSACPTPDMAKPIITNSSEESFVNFSNIGNSNCNFAKFSWHEGEQILKLTTERGTLNDYQFGILYTDVSCWIETDVNLNTKIKSINIILDSISLQDQYYRYNLEPQYQFELLAGYSSDLDPNRILLAGRISNTDGIQEVKFNILSNLSIKKIYIGFRLFKINGAQINIGVDPFFVIKKISLKK